MSRNAASSSTTKTASAIREYAVQMTDPPAPRGIRPDSALTTSHRDVRVTCSYASGAYLQRVKGRHQDSPLEPSNMPFTIAIMTVVLSCTWFFQLRWPASFVAVPVAAVLVLGAWKAALTGETGVKPGALMRALAAASIFTIVVALILVAAGAARGTLHSRPDSRKRRGVDRVGRRAAVDSADCLSARGPARDVAAHGHRHRRRTVRIAPPSEFVADDVDVRQGRSDGARFYDRYPNVIPLALSHAAATLIILRAFDDATLGGLRVGARFF